MINDLKKIETLFIIFYCGTNTKKMGQVYKYRNEKGDRWNEYWFCPEIWDIIKEYLLPNQNIQIFIGSKRINRNMRHSGELSNLLSDPYVVNLLSESLAVSLLSDPFNSSNELPKKIDIQSSTMISDLKNRNIYSAGKLVFARICKYTKTKIYMNLIENICDKPILNVAQYTYECKYTRGTKILGTFYVLRTQKWRITRTSPDTFIQSWPAYPT